MPYSARLKEISLFKVIKKKTETLGTKALFNLAEKGKTRTNGWKIKPDV